MRALQRGRGRDHANARTHLLDAVDEALVSSSVAAADVAGIFLSCSNWTADRTPDAVEWLADMLGALSGLLAGSVALPWLKYVSGGVGAGLAFAALTDTCAMGSLLARLPYNRAASCDVDAVVAELIDASTSCDG